MASDHALPRVGRFGFADYPPQIWLLLGGSFLVRALGFAYPFMAYFVIERGHGPAVVSIVVASCGAGWVLGLLVCGSLVDRIGGRLTLMTAMIGAAGVLCALAVSHSVPMLVGGAVLFGFLFDAPRPIISAAITELIPDSGQRARIDAFRYGWVVNGGGAITGALGGLLALRIGVPALFLVHAAACAVFAVLAPHSPRPQRVSVSQVSELLSARRPGSSSPSESSTGSRHRNGAASLENGGPPMVATTTLIVGLLGAALCLPLARHLQNTETK